MNYHIMNESGTVIASFVNESDRDYSYYALCDAFPDCELITHDN